MKKSTLLCSVAFFAASSLFSFAQETAVAEVAAVEAAQISAAELEELLTSTNWSVTYEEEEGVTETVPEVSFNEDGTLEVIDAGDSDADEAPTDWNVEEIDGRTIVNLGAEEMQVPAFVTAASEDAIELNMDVDLLFERALEMTLESMPEEQKTPEMVEMITQAMKEGIVEVGNTTIQLDAVN